MIKILLPLVVTTRCLLPDQESLGHSLLYFRNDNLEYSDPSPIPILTYPTLTTEYVYQIPVFRLPQFNAKWINNGSLTRFY